MIDSTNLMLVAVPSSSLQAPTENIVARKNPGITPQFAPINKQTIVTENGYVVRIPHMIGSETKVKKLGGGYYLVTSKPIVYGAKPKTRIMTEEELVEKYHGTKIPLMKKDEDDSTQAKLQRALLQMLTAEPQVCYLA